MSVVDRVRLTIGIAIMLLLTFGQLAVWFWLGFSLLFADRLLLGFIVGVAGPLFALWSSQVAARYVAMAVSYRSAL